MTEKPNKVRLANGPFIKPSEHSLLRAWKGSYHLSYGELIGQLIDHANATGFKPKPKDDNHDVNA